MMKLESKLDASVNFITATDDGGFFESRYVRRSPEYFICYLSSHSGCNRGCKMCHLTASKQTMMREASLYEMRQQARKVLLHYKKQDFAKFVHFNWMARGEALASSVILNDWFRLTAALTSDCYSLLPKFNVSTIMPKTLNRPLEEIFRGIHPTIYYSIYSTNEDFRNRWLPGAMPVDQALKMLKQYQVATKKIVKLHWAFIEGENDSEEDVSRIAEAVAIHDLDVEINIVRYNPPDATSREAADVEGLAELLRLDLGLEIGNRVQVVPRVGQDCYASCGTFYGAER